MITREMLLQILAASQFYRILTQDMQSDVVMDLREEGLIECGQELRDFTAAAFPDGVQVTGGVPNPMYVWLRLSTRGQKAIPQNGVTMIEG